MLKASLLAAAAFAIVAVAAPMGAYAQQDGSRQIVVEPVEVGKGPGTGGGGGLGTGGGDGSGTGGGKKTPKVIAPVVVNPGSDAGPDVASGGETKTQKIIVDPTPKVSTEAPAIVEADPLDAIIGSASTETATKEAPILEGAPVATATTTATVDSPDELIVFLKAQGYQVELTRKEKDGDYVLVVHNEEDKVSGYLLVVDGKYGKVVAKQKIDLAEYGYGKVEEYAPAKKSYSPPKKSYDEGYESDESYDNNSGYDSGYEDNSSYGSSGGSDY